MQKRTGYGRTSWKKWLAIYAIAGAILYVIGELFSVGRKLSWEITLWGVLIGFLLGLGTELVIVAAGA